MKKLYVQPEFDLVKFSSTEDILQNSLDEEADVSNMIKDNENVLDNGDYKVTDDDDSTIVDEWA